LKYPTGHPGLLQVKPHLPAGHWFFRKANCFLWKMQPDFRPRVYQPTEFTGEGATTELPSWDEVAGDPTTYENTYNPQGNALTLMSMNVRPDLQSRGLARKLIGSIQQVAQDLNIEHVIGSFRPNEFGKFKQKNPSCSFEEYCAMTREDGLPVDAWLRNLTRNGMKPLKIDHQAMVVTVPLSEFYEIQTIHKPEMWQIVGSQDEIQGVECGEVGAWHVDLGNQSATYIESNIWGTLPIK
jgi:GNAT superfamily N-acetyltransferase